MKINSVSGPIDTSMLGTTLMHEHITFAGWAMRENFKNRFYEPSYVEDAAAKKYAQAREECGIQTMVEATAINSGRDIELIRRVSQRSGVNVIVSSGFLCHEEPCLLHRPESEIYDLLSYECRHGIGDSGILPGIMKAGCDHNGVIPYTEKLIRTAARVGADLGLPIFVHHDPASGSGPRIMELARQAGLAPQRVILGHSGDTLDLDYLHRILDLGCYIGMDRFGYVLMDNSLAAKAKVIADLCREGYARQMMLSHDLAVFIAIYGMWDDVKDHLGEMYPDYTFIHKELLPLLEQLDVSQADIRQMLVSNPRNFFEGTAI